MWSVCISWEKACNLLDFWWNLLRKVRDPSFILNFCISYIKHLSIFLWIGSILRMLVGKVLVWQATKFLIVTHMCNFHNLWGILQGLLWLTVKDIQATFQFFRYCNFSICVWNCGKYVGETWGVEKFNGLPDSSRSDTKVHKNFFEIC